MNQNAPLTGTLLENRDVPVEQEGLGFSKAIEQGLIDVKESRTVSLSDARRRLELKLKEAS